MPKTDAQIRLEIFNETHYNTLSLQDKITYLEEHLQKSAKNIQTRHEQLYNAAHPETAVEQAANVAQAAYHQVAGTETKTPEEIYKAQMKNAFKTSQPQINQEALGAYKAALETSNRYKKQQIRTICELEPFEDLKRHIAKINKLHI